MLAILSPAKDMNVLPREERATSKNTKPQFMGEAKELIEDLRQFKKDELKELMKISDKLAVLNYDRYANWNKNHTGSNASQALYSFTGEAYRGLDAATLKASDAEYAQKVFCILSGLYGVLRPLDLIQPYRLEMGTKYGFRDKKNLYDFWGSKITENINKAIDDSPGEKVLVNLASNEYSKAIDFKQLKHKVVTPSFYEERNGKLKMITVYTKKARGVMTRFMIENHIEKLEDLKAFDLDGYYFSNENSGVDKLVFVR
ncbi:MAG: peroxide stress protein YaaA [Prolixibacteraceae bacterium]|nr:peroxide stress protein YaaA [Prolixibacteraceae bacterium]